MPTRSPVVWRRGRFALHLSGVAAIVFGAAVALAPIAIAVGYGGSATDPVIVAMVVASGWLSTIMPLHHELAHALAARRSGIDVIGAGVYFGGAYVELRPPSTGITPRAWVRTIAAGPASNVVVGASVLGVWHVAGTGWFDAIGICCLLVGTGEVCIGLANVVPSPRSDGRAIVEAFRIARSPLAT